MSDSNTLNALRDEALRTAEEKGFSSSTIGEDIALMHSELSEALEEMRSGRVANETYHEGEKPCGVPTELADVIVRILHFCRNRY